MSDRNEFVNIDDFIKLQQIGEGGFGRVCIAAKKDQKDKQLIAKISKKEFNNTDPQFELYIKREINAIARLHHPYIIKFIGYSPIDFEKNSYPVIFTEYLPNGSLAEIIQKERFNRSPKTWDDTKKLINIYGIASIMKYLHANKMLHRDLKPDNILEDEFLFPTIADFGLSKVIHNQETLTEESIADVKGTMSYIAPEIFKNNEYSTKSDVYAYAITIYEIITNRVPYKGPNYVIYNRVMSNSRPPIDNHIPKCYHDLITKCWSHNPSERPTFEEICNTLEKNKQFITKNVNEAQFHKYINIVENKGKPIDPIKKFTKVTISRSLSPPRIIQDHDQDPNSNSILNPNPRPKDKLDNYQQFNRLSPKTKEIMRKGSTNLSSDGNNIVIFNEDDSMFLANNEFDSSDFITMLHFFSKVIFELNDNKIEIFKVIFKEISKLTDTNTKNIEVHIHLRSISKRDIIDFIIKKNETVPISITIHDSDEIKSSYFMNCSSVFEIIIPPSITKICDSAFKNCSSLKEIKIPSSVEKIKENAFSNCTLLETVYILSSIKKIKEYTFSSCQSLTQIKIPESVEIIEKYAFFDCNSLVEIKIPSTVTKIEKHAFSRCEILEKITIPPNLTIIDECVFNECSSLKEITIPNSVREIKYAAFNACTSLNKIIFENNSSLSIINDGAFLICSSLEEITIPDSVKSIGKFCFNGCIKLKMISIPSINQISENMFEGCISLEQITIQNQTSSIDKKAFYNCIHLKKVVIPESVKSINYSSFSLCSSLIEITIPSSITLIDSYAFNRCTALTTLKIPSSVKNIGENAFSSCDHLKEIEFNPIISIIEKSLFEKCSLLESISIPSSVTKIKKFAFQGCSSMKTVTFCSPSNLSSIGEFAFNYCTNLKDISIPPKVKIDKSAFNNCPLLKISLKKNRHESLI